MLEIDRDHSGANRRFGFQGRLRRFASQRFIIAERVLFTPASERDRSRRHSRIFAKRIRILGFRNLLVKILRFVLAIDVLQAARLKVPRRKRESRFLRFGRRSMKERKRTRVILLGKQNFRDAVRSRSAKFALGIVIQDALETCPRRACLVQRPVTFGQIKIRARPAGRARILPEKFFVLRRREVEKPSREKAVCVIELASIGPFRFRGWCFGIIFTRARFRRTASRFGRRNRGIERDCSRCGRLVHRLGPPDFRRALLRKPKRNGRQNQRCLHEANGAPPCPHFAVAKATFVTPASLQIFSTPTMFL